MAITEDLHDVHNLGKEAAAVHRSLMEDLSKVLSSFDSFSVVCLTADFLCGNRCLCVAALMCEIK